MLINRFKNSAIALLFLSQCSIADETVQIGLFSTGNLASWEPHVFHQQTDYQLVADTPTVQVLKASSHDSASGLVKKQQIDLTKTPFINWRWKTTQLLSGVQERTKAGDDYVARVYVVLDGGLWFWRTKSINYVWASDMPRLSVWPNAYAGDAVQMLALRSKTDPLNTWMTEKRNVREDFKRYLGLDIQALNAVAIMTDTDNTHQSASSFYGDIFFSAQ